MSQLRYDGRDLGLGHGRFSKDFLSSNSLQSGMLNQYSAAAQNQGTLATQGLISSITYNGPSCPTEPSMLARASELLGYLHNLAAIQGEMRLKLIGPLLQQGESSSKHDAPRSLDELLAAACQLAASLVGEASTICSRV